MTGLTWGGGLTDGLAFVRTLPAIDLGAVAAAQQMLGVLAVAN